MSKELVEPAKIFSEEELKAIETTFYQLCHYGTMSEATRDHAIEVIASHRELLSANAELSFKNMQQRETIDHQHILLDKYESMINGG